MLAADASGQMKTISIPNGIRLPSRRTFLLIVGLSTLIYLLIFSLPYPLSQHYNSIPPVDYAKLTHYSVEGFVAYLVGLALLFGLYLWALRLIVPRNGEASQAVIGLRFVLVTGALIAIVLLYSYPVDAIDIFAYAVYTRGWALYGVNPLAVAPAQFPGGDPWVGLVAEWANVPSPYGPVWQVLSLGAYFVSGGDFLKNIYALKVIMILAYLGSAALIYLTLKARQPRWALAGTIAFAWNPLVLLAVAQNGHNDIVMIFFLLAAVWALVIARQTASGERRGWIYPLLVCLFLALSVLTKFITIVVVPFFLLALMSRGQRWPDRFARLIGFGLLTGGLIVIGMWPIWPGWDVWAVVQGSDSAGRSILALSVLGLNELVEIGTAFDVAQKVLLGLYVLIYGYALWRLAKIIWRAVDEQAEAIESQTLASSFLALFWLLLLVMPIFHAWYIVWSFPLAVLLLPQRRMLTASIVFSITALLVVPYFETIRVWYPVLLTNQLLGHLIGVTVLAAPPIVTLLWPRKGKAAVAVEV